MVDLPLCLQQLRSTLSDVERSGPSCQGSGFRPNLLAKLTRSRASLRSSDRLTITRPLQCPQNGSVRRWVRLQSPNYHRPKFQPFGRDVQVHHGAFVELASELAQELQVTPRLGDRGQGGPKVPGLLRTLQDVEGVCLQVPYLFQQIVRLRHLFGLP